MGKQPTKKFNKGCPEGRRFLRGSENGYLDNTKHFIFWLCNMKQLNSTHFNSNSIKFFGTVIFSRKKQKRLQKGQYHFVQYIKDSRPCYDNSGLFKTISEGY